MKNLLTTILILANLTGAPALALANESLPETQEAILLIPEILEYTNLEPELLYLLTSFKGLYSPYKHYTIEV